MSSQPINITNPDGGDIIFHDNQGWEIARFTQDRFIIKDKKQFPPEDLAERLYQLTLDILIWNSSQPYTLPSNSILVDVGGKRVIEITRANADYDTSWCVGGYEIMVMNAYINKLQKIILEKKII